MFRKTMARLAGIDDSPKRTALAFALGVLVGFSPLVGLHTVLGIALAFTFRLSRIATLAGTLLNLPWVMVPYYGLSAWVGGRLLGEANPAVPPAEAWEELVSLGFGHGIASHWKIVLPAAFGATILACVLAAAAYPTALFVLTRKKTAAPS